MSVTLVLPGSWLPFPVDDAKEEDVFVNLFHARRVCNKKHELALFLAYIEHKEGRTKAQKWVGNAIKMEGYKFGTGVLCRHVST